LGPTAGPVLTPTAWFLIRSTNAPCWPRGVAAEGYRDSYRRAHADARIEVVTFQPEVIGAAVQLRLNESAALTGRTVAYYRG
jgi:hypothetical protein